MDNYDPFSPVEMSNETRLIVEQASAKNAQIIADTLLQINTRLNNLDGNLINATKKQEDELRQKYEVLMKEEQEKLQKETFEQTEDNVLESLQDTRKKLIVEREQLLQKSLDLSNALTKSKKDLKKAFNNTEELDKEIAFLQEQLACTEEQSDILKNEVETLKSKLPESVNTVFKEESLLEFLPMAPTSESAIRFDPKLMTMDLGRSYKKQTWTNRDRSIQQSQVEEAPPAQVEPSKIEDDLNYPESILKKMLKALDKKDYEIGSYLDNKSKTEFFMESITLSVIEQNLSKIKKLYGMTPPEQRNMAEKIIDSKFFREYIYSLLSSNNE